MAMSPMVAQLEFSVRIRNRRNELGLDAKTVSSHLGFSRNFYSAVENNRSLLANDRLPALAQILQFDELEESELLELLEAARRPAWWNEYRSLVGNEDVLQLYGLEDGADTIDIYESMVVTGLLQTEEYAEAIIRADPDIARSDVRRYVELRKRRQARLFGADPPQLTVVMSEAAIRQEIGEIGVLTRQLEQLLWLIEESGDWLHIRIQPFDVPAGGMAFASTLVLAGFDSPHLKRAVWREAGTPLGATEDPEVVDFITLSYSQILASSLSRSDSRDLIAERVP